jgi:hypothetical protein
MQHGSLGINEGITEVHGPDSRDAGLEPTDEFEPLAQVYTINEKCGQNNLQPWWPRSTYSR